MIRNINLTRQQRPYAVIENVITHQDYRKKGYGTLVMEKAVDYAKRENCYKIMLLSSSSRKDAHQFYERLGFDGSSKKGFQLRFS
jgi:GNAT superfamily N-acetyltransferase